MPSGCVVATAGWGRRRVNMTMPTPMSRTAPIAATAMIGVNLLYGHALRWGPLRLELLQQVLLGDTHRLEHLLGDGETDAVRGATVLSEFALDIHLHAGAGPATKSSDIATELNVRRGNRALIYAPSH